MIERIEAPSCPGLYSETIALPDGALDVGEILLLRDERRHVTHFGWMPTPRDNAVVEQLRDEGQVYCEIPSYVLLGARPQLLRVLALPEGSIVSFGADAITSIRDADNNDCLRGRG